MSAAVLGRSLARSIVARSGAKCSIATCTRLQPTPPRQSAPAIRSFSASTSAWEKKYTEDHEWIELAADGKTGTIGISEYAAKALGDVVFVELPTVDLEVSQGDSIGAVESVKSASDIMTPVSGKIVEANNVLEDTPGVLNKSPQGDGWLAKIECTNVSELDELMDAEGYKKFTEDADSE